MRNAGPIGIVLGLVLVVWYGATVWLNAAWVQDQAARAGSTVTFSQLVVATMDQERPVLPAPHQVAAELWKGLTAQAVTSKKSLVHHGLVTLTSTFWGFVAGTALGIAMAIAITRSRTMELGLMPWAIISQTIPIVALAPMIIVLSDKVGIEGKLIPKAIIAAYLSYFPVLVSMVKGLRSPDAMQLDLMRTYNANGAQTFGKLRLPSSMPYLFASLKVGVAASLVGTIVGELPTGAVAGLGSRLLSGSYYGQTVQIWAALFMAAAVAALLVIVVGFAHSLVLKRMGARA